MGPTGCPPGDDDVEVQAVYTMRPRDADFLPEIEIERSDSAAQHTIALLSIGQ